MSKSELAINGSLRLISQKASFFVYPHVSTGIKIEKKARTSLTYWSMYVYMFVCAWRWACLCVSFHASTEIQADK